MVGRSSRKIDESWFDQGRGHPVGDLVHAEESYP